MEFLPLVFDAIIILIFISCILDGRKKGFIKMILTVISAVLCFATAKEFSESVAMWLNENFVHSALSSAIANSISENLNEGTQAVIASLPQTLTDAVAQMGFSVEETVSGLSSQANVAQTAESIVSAAEGVLVLPLLNIISFIIIFLVCRFVLGFITGIINTIFKLPVIKGMNRFAGGILGAAKGVIVVSVVSMVACGVAKLLPDMPFAEVINNSTVITSVAQTVSELIGG